MHKIVIKARVRICNFKLLGHEQEVSSDVPTAQ